MRGLFLALALLATRADAACVSTVIDSYLSYNNDFADVCTGGNTITMVGTVPINTSPAPPIGTYQAGSFAEANYLSCTAHTYTALRGLTNWAILDYGYFTSLPNLAGAQWAFTATTDTLQQHLYLVRALSNGALRFFTDGGFSDSSAGVVTTSAWYKIHVIGDPTNITLYVAGSQVAQRSSAGALRSDINFLTIGRDGPEAATGFTTPLNGYINFFTVFNTNSVTTDIILTPTPTWSPSLTPTPTITQTWTNSPTTTPTFTATPSITQTWTNSPTPTWSPTATKTWTLTPTPTPTFTPTPTITSTASPTRTNSPVASSTVTVTYTTVPTAIPGKVIDKVPQGPGNKFDFHRIRPVSWLLQWLWPTDQLVCRPEDLTC